MPNEIFIKLTNPITGFSALECLGFGQGKYFYVKLSSILIIGEDDEGNAIVQTTDRIYYTEDTIEDVFQSIGAGGIEKNVS